MTTETVAKKIDELRVADLKVELEARSLDTHGIKTDLIARLKKVCWFAHAIESVFNNFVFVLPRIWSTMDSIRKRTNSI